MMMIKTCSSNRIVMILLLWLSVIRGADAGTWRRPTTRLATLRGGDDMIPIVPESVTASNVLPRGGSVTTTKKPKMTSAVVTGTRSVHVVSAADAAATTSTSTHPVIVEPTEHIVLNATITNATLVTTTEPSSVKPATATVKHHKRHKWIAKKLKNRNATNLRRKVMHASFGFFFAALNHFIPRAQFVPGMTLLTSATLLMELLRYRKGFGWMNDILHTVLGSSLRKHEMDGKFTGSFYYFLGVTLTAALYPTSCATLGICQLAIADPTASYFGRATRHIYWSRIENGLGGIGRNKGILGFIGGALACVPMNYVLLSKAQFGAMVPSTSAIWIASFALGFAGAFADLAVPTPTLTLPKKVLGVRVPPFHVDDNFVVPIFSGYACTKVFQCLAFPSNLALAKFLIV